MIIALALKSLRNRRFTAALTVISIALSVTLLLAVERLRVASREGFTAAVSGTDLIVGARSSPVHLLLYSVFHLGNATNNMRWESYENIARRPEVAWCIPLSLGDSHRGYRVLGTDNNYFAHFSYAHGRNLRLALGQPLGGADDAVLGAEVARALGYQVGDAIIIAHGAGEVGFANHDQHPFKIKGILARTGTPLDRVVHIRLEGLDAIHRSEEGDSADPLAQALHDKHRTREATPDGRTITAMLIGLRQRAGALATQRAINEYAAEPLTAILPAVTLSEVWEVLGAAERILYAVSWLVVVLGLAGMLVALLTSLSERRREMAVLRSVGARPLHLFALILGEAGFLTLCGIFLGGLMLYATLWMGGPWLEARFGLVLELTPPAAREWGLMAGVLIAGVLISIVPARRVYRYSLADGLTVRT